MSGSWSNSAQTLIVLIEDIGGYSGIFGYSPTIGAGSLVFSLAAAAGTDPYGNSYLAGMSLGADSLPQVQLIADALGAAVQLPTNRGAESVAAQLRAQIVSPGAANQILSARLRGPAQSGAGGSVDVILSSQAQDGSTRASLRVRDVSGLADLLTVDPAQVAAMGGALVVGPSGVITAYGAGAFPTYTPVVGGAGSATFTTLTGWYQVVGKMCFFTAYMQVNTAGSGASPVTITAPAALDRTTRQIIPASLEGAYGAGLLSTGGALAFTGGAGATLDRIRAVNAAGAVANLTGADLLASAIITVEGWCRLA